MHSLNQNIEVRYLGAAISAANNTNAASTVIDMQGYETVMFVTTIADSTAGGTLTLSVEQGAASDGSDAVLVTGTAAVATSAANDDLNNRTIESEVFRPSARYVRARRATATQLGAYGELYAILRPYRLPAPAGTAAVAAGYVAN
jgi:hypothetical protein